MTEETKATIRNLRATGDTAYVASMSPEGYPVLRAMFMLEHVSLRTQYFSTNTSSGKVRAFRENPKASVYFCAPGSCEGVLFVGEVEICQDQPTKDFLWREGFEQYYPLGVTDPDYCVLKFTAVQGAFNGSESCRFTMDELEV